MAKAIMETRLETKLYSNLNISTDEIVNACVDTSGVHVFQYMEKKNVYINRPEKDLLEYYTRLDEMKARVAEVQDNRKEEYLSQVENLENMRNMFTVKYGTLKKSSGDVWEDIKVATKEAWSELEYY